MDYNFSITGSTYIEIASLWMRGRGQRMIDGQVMLPGVYQSITLSNSRIHARVLKSLFSVLWLPVEHDATTDHLAEGRD